MRRVAPCHGVLTARMTPTAQAGWKSWYVSATRATRKTQTDRCQVRAERSPRGVHNTSAAPRQPHIKKVSSFSTKSGTVSLMSNSSANTITNNTATRLMSTVLMVRKPSVLFTPPYPGRSRSTVPPTNSGDWIIMSNSSGKRIMTTTRQCCLGVLTARMTPTAQAGWKSWYVSAPRGREGGKRNKGEETLSQWPRGLLIFVHHNVPCPDHYCGNSQAEPTNCHSSNRRLGHSGRETNASFSIPYFFKEKNHKATNFPYNFAWFHFGPTVRMIRTSGGVR